MVQYWNLILHLSICLCPLPTSFLFIFPALFCGDPLLYSPHVCGWRPFFLFIPELGGFSAISILFSTMIKIASITNMWHLFQPNFLFRGSPGKYFGSFPGTLFVFISIFYLYFFGTLFSFTRKNFLLFVSCTWIFLVYKGLPARNLTRLPDSISAH